MRPDQNEPAPALRALRKSVIRSARSPRVWFAFAVLLIALDYFSGPSLNLSLFFLVPVVAAAWQRRLRWAFALAVALPLCRLWFEWNWGAPWSLGDAAGNCLVRVAALVGFALVTSRLARAEARLRESERLYQSLVENIPQGIFRKDEAGRFTFANGRFCEHLGKPPDAVIGKCDEDLFPPDLSTKYRTDDQSVFETGRKLEIVEERRPLQGKPVYTHVIKTPLRDAESRIVGIQGIYWDVTEQRLLQDQLRQAQKMEAVGQLAGGVAHNFNNVLAAMMLNVELMLAENRLDAEARSLLQNLKTGIEHAARLTRQLLLFSRPSKMQTQALDLNKLVEKLLAMLSQLIGEQIELKFEPQDGPVEIVADESMVEQIILNLAINARDAMPNGGALTITVSRSIVAADRIAKNPEAQPGQFALLEISDTGCGMDNATLARIFEPFFTTKEVGRGTGLGLSTVYGIVKQHRGWIEVNSMPGRGSTFRVFLPGSAQMKPSEDESTATTSLAHGTETILLVEDETAVRTIAAKWLRRCGYQVLEAGNGWQAEAIWEKHAPDIDLLFSDVTMPGGMSGMQLAERLRSRRRELKIILWSGYSTDLEQQRESASQSGVIFLSKPCPPEEMAQAIRKCLGESATDQTSSTSNKL